MMTNKQMPTFDSDLATGKNPMEITGWTVQDRLEEIQAKIRIKEGHREWFAEKSKMQAEQKKKQIRVKRKENKALRIETDKALNPHPKIISDAMRYDRSKHCALAKRTVPDAIEWVDLESIDMEKACDELIYIRQKKEEQLAEAQQKLALLSSFVKQEQNKLQTQELQKIQYLQNEIQKKVTKEDTAFFVMKQYLAIAQILEEDMIHFDNILENLENDMKMQKEELKTFQTIQQEGEISKKETQRQYKQAEMEAAERAAEPERKLMMLKLEASSFTQYEMTTKRSITEFLDTEGADEAEKSLLKTRDMLSMYEESYNLLKDAMMATDIKQISVVLMAQEWTKEHLTQEISKHKEKLISQMEEYELLEETYLEVMDALDEKRKKMNEMQEEAIDKIQEKEKEIGNTQMSLNWLGNLLAKLKSDILHLLCEFEESELVIPEKTGGVTAGVDDLLDMCQKRLKNLVTDVEDLIEHLKDSEEKETFAEFLDIKQSSLSVEKRYVNYPSVKQVQKPMPLHEPEEDEDNMIREMIKKAADKFSRKMSAKKKKLRSTFI